jgi:amidase/6-aminohexanoate-cyclic-dimer hydrolase
LVETAVARAEQVNPQINAIAERLYDQASLRIAEASRGPFKGVPYALKDLHHSIAGVRQSCGSRAFVSHVPTENSETFDRILRAGLVPICTSTTPELGLTLTTESAMFGPTRNPWRLDRSSGGSSGGAAALVAAGVIPAAHATDAGGSIRIPAACCGLFGLKVSRGRTPVGVGRTESSSGLGVSHAVTRSVRDSAAILDATHGGPFGARYVAPPPAGSFVAAVLKDPKSLRIALQVRTLSGNDVHRECAEAAVEAAKLCEGLGHLVEEVSLPRELDVGSHATDAVAANLASTIQLRERQLGRDVADDELEPITALLLKRGRRLTALAMIDAEAAFMRAAIAMAQFQLRYEVILSPTLGLPAVSLGRASLSQPVDDYVEVVKGYNPFTTIYNITGQPAMSIPFGLSSEGTPLGIQFAARLGQEELLLSLAGQIERAKPWFSSRPAI